ncbi:MAG: non-canonical purine NTP pyrophosphatase [Oscillospiraceae bacterium]
MKVVLASKNPHKLVEISAILQPLQVELVLESELGVDIEVEETGQTFEENSFLKAHAVMQATGLPALADDSGIAVDALNGAPGVYSARYGDDPALDDWGRLLLLLKNTEHVPDGQRQAQFVSVITPGLSRRPRDSGQRRGPWGAFAGGPRAGRLWLRSDFLLPSGG